MLSVCSLEWSKQIEGKRVAWKATTTVKDSFIRWPSGFALSGLLVAFRRLPSYTQAWSVCLLHPACTQNDIMATTFIRPDRKVGISAQNNIERPRRGTQSKTYRRSKFDSMMTEQHKGFLLKAAFSNLLRTRRDGINTACNGSGLLKAQFKC
jgi:hypothetical protein